MTLGDRGTTSWPGEDSPDSQVHRFPLQPPFLHSLGNEEVLPEPQKGSQGGAEWGLGKKE